MPNYRIEVIAAPDPDGAEATAERIVALVTESGCADVAKVWCKMADDGGNVTVRLTLTAENKECAQEARHAILAGWPSDAFMPPMRGPARGWLPHPGSY